MWLGFMYTHAYVHLTDGITYVKAKLDTAADMILDKITFSLKGDYF